jgi:phage terminase small subunit
MNEPTTRQKLFIEAYLANPNATQAAITAGYSAKTAKSQGQRLLTKVDIQKAVAARVQTAIMTADEVLTELALIAKGDHAQYKSDKLKALELVGKHHKLFTDKTELTGKDGGAIETKFVVEVLNGTNGTDQTSKD